MLPFPTAAECPPGLGLDRLSVSGPIKPPRWGEFSSVQVGRAHEDDDGCWTLSRSYVVHDGPRVDGRRPKPKASVFVGARQVQGVWWGKWECNPARLYDPDGISTAPLERLQEAVDWMVDVGGDAVDPICESDELRLRRVDVALDLQLESNASQYVWGLLNQKRAYSRRQFVYSDPDRNRAQTLYAGSGAGGVRAYDCFEAHAEQGAAERSLRFEVEARPGWITSATKTEIVGRVTPDHLLALASQRWDWMKMGTEITSTDDVVQRVEAVVDGAGGWPLADGRWFRFSRAKADRFLGMLVREARGVNRSSCKYTASEYSKIKTYFGVVATPMLFAGSVDKPLGRLDFLTAREIVAA